MNEAEATQALQSATDAREKARLIGRIVELAFRRGDHAA